MHNLILSFIFSITGIFSIIIDALSKLPQLLHCLIIGKYWERIK